MYWVLSYRGMHMSKFDMFVNQYPLSKTLRFRLIPQGKTKENLIAGRVLETDKKRAADYADVKKYIDRYHKKFIDEVLDGYKLPKLAKYAALYNNHNRTPQDNQQLRKLAEELRDDISKRFTQSTEFKDTYNLLSKKELIKKELPASGLLYSEHEKEQVDSFASFTSYFGGYHNNRKNLYTGDGKSTEIAYRIVDQNLPKFLDNCNTSRSVLSALDEQSHRKLSELAGSKTVDEFFSVDFFSECMTQEGIERYNRFLGGYIDDADIKHQGINELINLHNQQTGDRLPQMKMLYKQILSDRESGSFVLEKFTSDNEVLQSIRETYSQMDTETRLSMEDAIHRSAQILINLSEYDINGIYISSGPAISDLSNGAFGSWSVIQDGLNNEYDARQDNRRRINSEKYEENRRKYFKAIESFSLTELSNAASTAANIQQDRFVEYISDTARRLSLEIDSTYTACKKLLDDEYPFGKKLVNQDDDIELLKNFLDSIMGFHRFVKAFQGSGKEADKTEAFYGEFDRCFALIDRVVPLYNMVRNYVTQKPYTEEKLKLTFDNSMLLEGWDENKETDYCSVLLEKDERYYLGIIPKGSTKVFTKIPVPDAGEPVYNKIIYKLLPDPKKNLPRIFFSKKWIDENPTPVRIQHIYESGTFKKEDGKFVLEDCYELIDFYKKCISQYKDWQTYGFRFSPTSSYQNITDFYDEVKRQGYKITYRPAPVSYIDSLIDGGKLYLFQLYNKDFSVHSKGSPNLHTLYFRMLFAPENLKNVVYALSGGAEIFYREKSLTRQITHPANRPIKNKNPDNLKPFTTLSYDLYKDKRYTEDQFFLHVPIKMNFKAIDKKASAFNHDVRCALREAEHNYVIGIDRGERNLLYISVIDDTGRILEQCSMNTIINECNSITYKTNYHKLLDRREEERQKARQNWQSIENIKELKEGYISQVVHKISELALKYDAVIAMENLNSGFKNSRVKVEKQVYQKFEKMLIDKLNYLVFKDRSADAKGGLLHAYQLATAFTSFRDMTAQNGFIFYIPPWLTSKIDPTTGFVNLLDTRYKSIEQAQNFFSRFNRIVYSKDNDWFEFDLDYSRFERGDIDFQRKWTLTTQGKRVRTFRDSQNNNRLVSEEVELTECFRKLLTRYSICYTDSNLKEQIAGMSDKPFLEEMMKLVGLMVQMRNSVTGTDIDYMVSPVQNHTGKFYNSNDPATFDQVMPVDADANGAYHIARKAQWVIERIQSAPENEIDHVKTAVTNADWLRYVQESRMNG